MPKAPVKDKTEPKLKNARTQTAGGKLSKAPQLKKNHPGMNKIPKERSQQQSIDYAMKNDKNSYMTEPKTKKAAYPKPKK